MIKTLIWIEDESSKTKLETLVKDKTKVNFFISNFKETKFNQLKKMMKKNDSSRTLKFNKNLISFELIYKSNSIWTKLDFDECVSKWMQSNDLSFYNKEWNSPDFLIDKKKKIDIKIPFDFNQIQQSGDILDFFTSEDAVKRIDNLTIEKTNNLSIKEFKIKSHEDFIAFSDRISKTNQRGINRKKCTLIDENKIELEVEYGKIFIEYLNDEKVRIITALTSTKKSDLFFYNKGINSNIVFNINNETTTITKPKINKKNAILGLVSFILIISLFYITFNFIFSPHNSATSIEILFNTYTWKHIWIYLMWVNFIFSLFMNLIISIIIVKVSNPNKKIEWKKLFNIYISTQIKMVATFLTGNPFLATFFWGWYVVKTTNTKTVGLVGIVASMSILRGLMLIPIGFVFMLRGTIYNFSIMNIVGMGNDYVAYIVLAWLGWIWHIVHNLSICLLIILPPLHILVNKFQITWFGRKGNIDFVNNKLQNMEMNISHLKSSFGTLFKRKDLIYRVTLFIALNIFLETLEFTYALRMTEDYAINVVNVSFLEKSKYLNIFAISGSRYMSGFVHHVPILNVIPGQGMGITDYVLNSNTFAIIGSKHPELLIDHVDTINDLAEQTTFIIRFFNFYLKRAIALLMATTFITKAILSKKKVS